MPVIRLKSVVLPAPFGPISETISPSLTSMSRSETTRRPPNESETLLQLEQGHQTISTRFSPSRPFGPQDHQADQHEPDDDVPRRLGLREHHVLPDERSEVEHGHEQPPSATSPWTQRQPERRGDQADVGRRRDPRGEMHGDDHPVRHPAAGGARRPRVADRARRSRARRSRPRSARPATAGSFHVSRNPITSPAPSRR